MSDVHIIKGTQAMVWVIVADIFGTGSGDSAARKLCNTAPSPDSSYSYYERLRDNISSSYNATLPSFASRRTSEAPTYELKWNEGSQRFETTLSDSNGVLSDFDFGISGYSVDKNGNSITISSTSVNTTATTGTFTSNHFKWTNRFYTDFDLKKAFELSKKFDLDTNKRFKALSKGYQSIFKLIIALSLNVPYVIFDEPVLGLDANHRELFYSLLLKEFENNERTLIIATHLIEEVSNIIEEVVLIDKGKILVQETVEELLEKGYSVSGAAQEVDHYCVGRNVIGYDELGGLKVAYVLGEKTVLPQESNLQITAMNLQKLFVKMTEKGGGENE